MRDVVVVGLGHAHLYVASQVERFRAAGLRLVLIDDGEFWYSSIGSGMLGGRYERADDVIEAEPFARGLGIDFVRGRAKRIDRERRQVVLESGDAVRYDLVSLNVGSHVAPPFPVEGVEGVDRSVWFPKPIRALLDLRARLSHAFRSGTPVRWVTVGGNHSGCELTLNALALARAEGGALDATLVADADELVTNEPRGARRAMRRALEHAGCTVRLGARVQRVTATEVHLATGDILPHDHALIATGLAASPLVMECDLPADARDGLSVTPALHAPGDSRVFAAGDCASIIGYDLPKVGVFGVRASPVLADNLLARAAGGPLRRYRPQPIWFAAQNLGDGTGLASWGPIWWRGRSALALKDWNDRRFMDRYKAMSTA